MAPKPKPRLAPIRAWHASRVPLEKFDPKFMGTGAGSQAFGHGHYFGGRPVAGSYFDGLLDETHALDPRGWAKSRKSGLLSFGPDQQELADLLNALALDRDVRNAIDIRNPARQASRPAFGEWVQQADDGYIGALLSLDPTYYNRSRTYPMPAIVPALDALRSAAVGSGAPSPGPRNMPLVYQSAAPGDPIDLREKAHEIVDTLTAGSRAQDIKNEINKLVASGVTWPTDRPYLHKVEIDADPGAMIDLDAPLWRQPQNVKDAVLDLGLLTKGNAKRLEKAFRDPAAAPLSNDHDSGFWMYEHLVNKAKDAVGSGLPPRHFERTDRLAKDMVTSELLARGVPGIRFLDKFSRKRVNATGRPTQNTVMFPGTENLIRIIRRYGFVPPALYASMQGENNEAQAGMMDFFRKAASGQPMSRREFLRGAGGAAAAAAASRIPVPATPAAAPAVLAQNNPFLDKEFMGGFDIPHVGGDIVYLDGRAVPMFSHDGELGALSGKQLQEALAVLQRARESMPRAQLPWRDRSSPDAELTTTVPLRFNHQTGEWHAWATEPVQHTADVDGTGYSITESLRRPLKPGLTPDQVGLRNEISGIDELADFEDMLRESASVDGTLTSPPGMYGTQKRFKPAKNSRGEPPRSRPVPQDAMQSLQDEWNIDRNQYLRWQQREAGGDARKLEPELLEDFELAPGGRYEGQVPALTPEANAMGSNMGLPGDEPTERTGRIRRFIQMGVPLAAATGVSTIAQARTPEEEQAARMDFLREAMPPQDFEGRKHRIGALRESGLIPEPPPPDPFAAEREAARSELSYKFQAQGMERDVAELYATRTMELQRPTISARYVHENIDSDYDPNGAPVSPAWVLQHQSTLMALAGVGDQKTLFNKAVRSMAGLPAEHGPYGDVDEAVGMMRQGVLQAIEQHAPEGAYSDRSGIPQEEFDRLREVHGDNANFAYPSRLQKNFDALRQFELFTAGTDLDERETPGGKAIRGIADALYVQPGMAAANTMSPGMAPGAWAWGAAPDIKGRVAEQASDKVGRARDALEWYRNSAPQQGDYQFYRDRDTNNARYRAYSTTTPTGLSRAMTDADRRYGRWSLPTLAFTQNPFTGKSSEIADIRLHTRRPVPIIPRGMTPEEVSQAGDAIRDYDQKSDDWFASGYAKRIGDNPTHFQNSLFNLGRDSGDIGTLSTLPIAGGLGALRGVATGSVIKGLQGVGAGLMNEAFEEGLEGTASNTALTGAFGVNPFSKKEDNSLAIGPDGKPVQPYDPKYGETVDSNWEQARKDMDFTTGLWSTRKNRR